MDINAKRGPIKTWIGQDSVQAGIHRLFRDFLQTFSLQGEHVYQGRLREMCSCAPSSHAVSWACLPIAGCTSASQPHLGLVEPQPCIHPSWAALKVLHGSPQILHAAAEGTATCCSSTISRCAFRPASRAADCMLVL